VDGVRVCVVSDTHLSADAPEAEANWCAVVDHVATTATDLVIHAGDLCLDGTNGGDLDHARQQLDRLTVPWAAVPGNHDIGDNPWPGAPETVMITAARRQRWLDRIGPDFWMHRIGPWTLVAVNAQLFGSGLDAEDEQWAWLSAAVGADEDRPLVIVSHKPVAAPADELAAAPPYRFAPIEARRRLVDLARRRPVTMVVSGHVHQYRALEIDGTRHVWAPTTWAVLPDEVQPRFGTKRTGVLTLDLSADGAMSADLDEPLGIAQHTLTVDVPNPYQH
jgi:3',5'-cyclic AMP phosphodiesterase CpdA